MYIEQLVLDNIRTFTSSKLNLIHPELSFRTAKSTTGEPKSLLPRPLLPNVNLLLGDNASGKTTILQAIALAALGPAAPDLRLPLYLLRLRQKEHFSNRKDRPNTGSILADFSMHEHDRVKSSKIQVMQLVETLGELERSVYSSVPFGEWNQIYESRNASFFCVAYGAFRRVESAEDQLRPERSAVSENFPRRLRVLSAFQDSYPLTRLSNWLPKLRETHHDRYKEIMNILHKLLGPGHVRCAEKIREREYLFERGETLVPFPLLSDGYRGYIGWVGDLLYHMNQACSSGLSLADLRGIVMVDEIDLLLHPRWQMKVIATVARTLPRMQFIFTSHSPLVASSLEWMNIYTLKLNLKANRATAKRLRQSIHGLDADQVLISQFFGLESTVAGVKRRQLDDITDRIRSGDKSAALELIQQMSSGTEVEE